MILIQVIGRMGGWADRRSVAGSARAGPSRPPCRPGPVPCAGGSRPLIP